MAAWRVVHAAVLHRCLFNNLFKEKIP